MKKLLFITWSVSYGYGTEKSLADVVNRMDAEKYEIHILPLFKKSESHIFHTNIQILEPLIDYTEENFDEQAALNHYYSLLANPMQFNKRVTERYDCVIACNHNAPSYFASYLSSPARILWIRGDMSELDYRKYEEGTEKYRQVRQEYEMQARVFGEFQAIVVISQVVQRTLKELFGITEHVYKISNSVDSAKITALGRKQVSLPQKRLFTCPGRLEPNKNQLLLLKAAVEVKKRRNDFMIYLLGDGEDKKILEAYIKENGLEENARILGFVENPYPYMRSSVATVLTSCSEGFSLVLVESVMLNTPIISTDVGVARELVEKYHCGTLIGNDERELAAVMLNYLDCYKGYREIFDVREEYDIRTEVEKTEQLICRVMEQQSRTCKIKRLNYPEVTICEEELEEHKIPEDEMYVLRVMKNGVPYEYLIHRKSESSKLIVFHNGAVAGGNITVPVFQRHSWAKLLKTSSVFCMDPTLYLNGYLQVGWGIGKNEDYYLENSSLILKRITEKMGIRMEDTAIYGSSAGGYLSILMGIYLKGATVVADNAQLDVRYWNFKDALDRVITFCFDNIGSALEYPERFQIAAAFEKHAYVPKIYLHVNLCSQVDNSTQLVPFLKSAEKMKNIGIYRGIEVILHYEPEKGHNGISMEEAIAFLYSVLDVD